MASDVAAGKTRTAESIVEEAQGKLNELEHRIKEAIEKNAQLKSIEMLQTDQLTKEKVEELYKTREEQIHKKQKILEELQKVERELQLKTQQQLKKHYLEMKQGEGQQRGKPDGEDREQTAQNAKVNDDPQPQVQRERNQTASTTQTPELSTKQLKQPKHQNNQTLNN
uniref:Uncharacterized protein n=2 Tax=Ciona intestinalis TaxID=7719 RepID=H2Y2R4_CIOIN